VIYLVKNEQGEIVNRIEWDGVTEYDPGDGLSLELAPEPAPTADIGEQPSDQ